MAPTTVLIADKPHDLRELLHDVLHSEGYRCVLAADELEAMNALRDAQPDLVITGMNLPPVTGLELLRHIRANSPDTAVLVMAADVEPTIKVIHAEGALEWRQLHIERRSAGWPSASSRPATDVP